MLSSIILSFAMSTTPAVANVTNLYVEEIGTRRGQVRISNEGLNVTEVGTRRGQVRINNEKLSVTEIGTRRGQVRI